MTGLWAFELQLPYQKYQGPPIVVRYGRDYTFTDTPTSTRFGYNKVFAKGRAHVTITRRKRNFPFILFISRCCCTTIWPNSKKTAKKGFKKFVKLLDHTFVCNDFTNFECEGQATGNGSCVNLQKLAIKNSLKSLWSNLFFSAVFCHLEPLCAPGLGAMVISF